MLLRAAPIIGCILTVLGAKLWLIALFGSDTPYWDQWDAEAARLYKPYLEGNLHLVDLIAAHNEHRILFTRLLGLGLLELNGHWSPLLEIVVNAFLHVAAIGVLLALLARTLSASQTVALTIFAALIFSLPVGWENLLAGFQSQFYFLLLLSFLAFGFYIDSPAYSARWLAATLFGALSLFTVASGSLTMLALASVGGLQLLMRMRTGWRELTGLGLHAALAVIALVTVPVVPGHDPLGAQSISQFFNAFVATTSWPRPGWLLTALLVNLPIMVVATELLRQKAPINDPRWLYVLVGTWLVLQCASLAYGRAIFVLSSRYLDLFVVGTVTNFAALLTLVQDSIEWRKAAIGATAAWLLVILASFSIQARYRFPGEIVHRYTLSQIQTEHLGKFLRSGTTLANKPHLHIPYPRAERLEALASDVTIRAVLPPSLTGASMPKTVSLHTRDWLLHRGFLMLPVGIVILLLSLLHTCGRDRNKVGAW